jgi:hypothetical protein
MLSVTNKSFMLSIIMLNNVMLSVIMLTVVMPSAVALYLDSGVETHGLTLFDKTKPRPSFPPIIPEGEGSVQLTPLC